MSRIAHQLRARRAFTLVELLTVIVIIGILAGLITAAAVRARTRARVVAIKSEITQLQMACEAYKQKYGEYPPDLTDLVALDRHLKRAFPRYRYRAERPYPDFPLARQFLDDVAAAYGISSPDLLGPASALVIFLGGVPEQAGSTKPAGFHADPKNPFRSGEPRTPPFYEFDVSRLTISDPSNPKNKLQYRPAGAATGAPYVYFKSRRVSRGGYQYDAYEDNNGNVLSYRFDGDNNGFAGDNICVPYLDPPKGSLQWAEAGKFQIICAGLDGIFGTAPDRRYRKLGENFSEYDYDNITNFSEGTLEDELE